MLNEFKVIGRLTQDAELRQTHSGRSVTNLFVASNYSVKNAQGQYEDRVDFLQATVWGKKAETIVQYAKKGRLVYLSGQIKQMKQEINNRTYTFHELHVDAFKFLDSVNKAEHSSAGAGANPFASNGGNQDAYPYDEQPMYGGSPFA